MFSKYNVIRIINEEIDKVNEEQIIFEYPNLKNIVEGKETTLYHGTNRDFNVFDMNQVRDWRAEKFLGKGFFFTPDINVAYRYANANANKELPITILEDAEKINKNLAAFMKSLYYKGNITWTLPEFNWINNWEFEVDPNDVAELVNLISGSKSAKDYAKYDDNENAYVDIFNTSSSALDHYHIQYLKQLGFGDYSPKVLTVTMKPTNSVLISNKIEEVKNSIHKVTIAYNLPDLLENVPEVKVLDSSLLRIVNKNVIEYSYDE